MARVSFRKTAPETIKLFKLRPLSTLSRVVLPDPLAPMIASNEPALSEPETVESF